MTKTALVLFVWALTAPAFMSIVVSILASVYFTGQIYYQIVNKYHGGSWRSWFRAVAAKVLEMIKKG